jgi:predicted amidohydrolase
MAEQHLDGDGNVDTEKCYNTSVVYAPTGERLSSYRKIHLFDVDIPGGMSIAESDRVVPGGDAVVVDTEHGQFGLSICYDLRFPELYRSLQEKGANVLLIPSAFTQHTGEAHWHILLRSRAIEFQSWVIAAAQTGTHDVEGTRQSYGHALIIDPWGRVVADAKKEEGYIMADIDLDQVTSVRASMPVETHRRM